MLADASIWPDVLKALIGTLAGAFLAFGSAIWQRRLQERQAHLVAGNLALFKLFPFSSDHAPEARGGNLYALSKHIQTSE